MSHSVFKLRANQHLGRTITTHGIKIWKKFLLMGTQCHPNRILWQIQTNSHVTASFNSPHTGQWLTAKDCVWMLFLHCKSLALPTTQSPRDSGGTVDKQPGATSGLAHPNPISAGWPYLRQLQAAHVNVAQVWWLPYTMMLQLEHSAKSQLSRPQQSLYNWPKQQMTPCWKRWPGTVQRAWALGVALNRAANSALLPLSFPFATWG